MFYRTRWEHACILNVLSTWVISVEIVPATMLNCDVRLQKHPKLFSEQRRVQSRASSLDTAADNLCGAIVVQQAYNEIHVLPKKFVCAVNAARKPAHTCNNSFITSVSCMHHLLNFLFPGIIWTSYMLHGPFSPTFLSVKTPLVFVGSGCIQSYLPYFLLCGL